MPGQKAGRQMAKLREILKKPAARAGLFAAFCAAVFAGAFFVGRALPPTQAPAQEEGAQQSANEGAGAPAKEEMAFGAVGLPELPVLTPAPQAPASAQGGYELRLGEEGLCVLQGGEVLLTIEEELALSEAGEAELKKGIAFASLAEIESFLESWES